MAFSEMKMRELGRNIWNDTHNITSLIRTPQKSQSVILETEDALTVEEYKHTNTHTEREKERKRERCNVLGCEVVSKNKKNLRTPGNINSLK